MEDDRFEDDEENEEEDIEIPEGIFKEDLEQIREWNERVKRNTADDLARGYISGGEADLYLKQATVNLPEAIENAKKMEQYLREGESDIIERQQSGQISEFGAEVEMYRLNEKRIKLEKRLHLNSVGLNWDDIGDVVDDFILSLTAMTLRVEKPGKR